MIGRGSVTDRIVARSLALLALSSIAILASITFFIFREGAPLVHKVGLRNFFGGGWHPTAGAYGVSLMIVGSAAVTAGALALAVPPGLACAIVLAEMAPARLRRILKPAIEILAGIPSVVYGFMGIVIVLPWIRRHLGGPACRSWRRR